MAKKRHRIEVDTVAKTSKLRQGFARGKRSVKSFGRDLKGLKRIMAGVGFVLLGNRIARYVSEQARAIDSLAKFSQQIGISSKRLAGLQVAAKITGVETNTLNLGLQRMTRRIAEAAQGAGEAQTAIKELGLDARQLAAAGPGEAFNQIAQAFAKIENQSDKVRLAFKLFDSEGVALARTLDLGVEGLDQMQKKAERLGFAVSRIDAESIEKMNDASAELGVAWDGLLRTLTVEFAPVITKIVGALTEVTTTFGILVDDVKELGKGIKEAVAGPSLEEQRRLFRLQQGIAGTATAQEVRDKLRREAEQQARRPPPAPEALLSEENLKRQFEQVRRGLLSRRQVIQKDFDDRIAIAQEAYVRLQGDLDTHLQVVQGLNADRARRLADLEEREGRARNQRLDAIFDSFQTTERERIEAQFAERLRFLDEFLAEENTRLAEADVARRMLVEEREKALTAIEEREAARRSEIAKAEANRRWQAARNIIGALKAVTSINAQESEKAFRINKAASIAEAVVNTAAGVTRAFRDLPPIAAWAQAAAVAASGAAQIAAIRAQTFTGGGSAAAVSGTAAAAAAPAARPAQQVILQLDPDAVFTGRQIRSVIEGIREGREDGFDLQVVAS